MSNIIANIAKLFGWKTWYYITYRFPVVGGVCSSSNSFSVTPWLRQGKTMNELLKFLHEESLSQGNTSTKGVNIISITRIGG